METQFYIMLSLRVTSGFTTYGKYFLGNDQEAAYLLFDSLNGDQDFNDHRPLHIDLMETVDKLPVKVRTKCCTLDELGLNCKLIAREVFRRKNFREIE